jgi:hypothetical protein
MKTESQRAENKPPDEAASVIDTSKMSPEQRAALELTEAAREVAQAERGFSGG